VVDPAAAPPPHRRAAGAAGRDFFRRAHARRVGVRRAFNDCARCSRAARAKMLLLLQLIAVFALADAYRPGVPPQCFDEYQCIFHRFNLGGLEYIWDLRSLCA